MSFILAFIFFIFLLIFVVLLFGQKLLVLLLRRMFHHTPNPSASVGQKKRVQKKSVHEKVDMKEVNLRRFDKDQGEYVDFEEEKRDSHE